MILGSTDFQISKVYITIFILIPQISKIYLSFKLQLIQQISL